MLGQASNEMLTKAEQSIQSKVAPNMQGALQKVVTAGLTIMYSAQLKEQRMQRIAASTDPAKEAGEGAARLVANLYQQSGKTMPPAVIGPAAMIFAFEYLDLLAKSGKAQITPDMIDQATQTVNQSLMQVIKTPDGQTAQTLVSQRQAQQQSAPAGIINRAQGA